MLAFKSAASCSILALASFMRSSRSATALVQFVIAVLSWSRSGISYPSVLSTHSFVRRSLQPVAGAPGRGGQFRGSSADPAAIGRYTMSPAPGHQTNSRILAGHSWLRRCRFANFKGHLLDAGRTHQIQHVNDSAVADILVAADEHANILIRVVPGIQPQHQFIRAQRLFVD